MEKEARLLKQNLAVYSFAHAVVDAVCAFAVFSIPRFIDLSFDYYFNLIILYSLIAFAPQFLLGALCDKLKSPRYFALAGIAITALSLSFISISPLLTVIVAGVGNALFHVGGGTISLNITPKKATAPGIFVAPGAIGLFAGVLIGKQGWLSVVYPAILIIFTFILVLITREPKLDYERKPSKQFNYIWLIILLLLASVLIRSFIGFMIIFPWKSHLSLAILFVIGVFLGKALGGYLGDKFGWMNIGVGSLVVSAFLLALGSRNPTLGILGILLFNMSMSLTLIVISNLLPGRPGFAFGLTVLALIIGALPYYAELKITNTSFYFITILISAIAFYLALIIYKSHPLNAKR